MCLKKEQLSQALDVWSDQVRNLDSLSRWRNGVYNQVLFSILKGQDAVAWIGMLRDTVLNEELTEPCLSR